MNKFEYVGEGGWGWGSACGQCSRGQEGSLSEKFGSHVTC